MKFEPNRAALAVYSSLHEYAVFPFIQKKKKKLKEKVDVCKPAKQPFNLTCKCPKIWLLGGVRVRAVHIWFPLPYEIELLITQMFHNFPWLFEWTESTVISVQWELETDMLGV